MASDLIEKKHYEDFCHWSRCHGRCARGRTAQRRDVLSSRHHCGRPVAGSAQPLQHHGSQHHHGEQCGRRRGRHRVRSGEALAGGNGPERHQGEPQLQQAAAHRRGCTRYGQEHPAMDGQGRRVAAATVPLHSEHRHSAARIDDIPRARRHKRAADAHGEGHLRRAGQHHRDRRTAPGSRHHAGLVRHRLRHALHPRGV